MFLFQPFILCDVFDGYVCVDDVKQLFVVVVDEGKTTNASILHITDSQHAIYVETRPLPIMVNIEAADQSVP